MEQCQGGVRYLERTCRLRLCCLSIQTLLLNDAQKKDTVLRLDPGDSVMGYGEIGFRLKGNAGPYADWVATYVGEEYQQLCHDVGGLLDRALERRLGPLWMELPIVTHLQKHFNVATRLEIGFWEMALHPERT